MKVFDSLQTMSVYHRLFNEMNSTQQGEFERAVFGLFDDKQVSDEGDYDTFKITKSDVLEIADKIQNI